MTIARSRFASGCATALLALVLFAACKDRNKDPGTGIVADAGTTQAPIEAGPTTTIDPSLCPGCQLSAQPTWTFEGIYRDDKCTEPLAQAAIPACANVPALGQTTFTYVDEVGLRKAAESATVTLAEQIAPEAARFRKAGKGCVRANEAAVHLTPLGCTGQRVCRDQTSSLACANCRTYSNGCITQEETRIYAAITDPGLKTKTGTGGGGNVGRLQQCCAQLSAEAKRLGPSPEAGLLASAAAQCSALVAAAGPNGTAPELGAIRTLLAGRNVPAVCAGF